MVEEWYIAEKCPHCYKDSENHFRCGLHDGARVNAHLRVLWVCPIKVAFTNQKRFFDLLKKIEEQNCMDTYIGEFQP